MPRGGDDIEDLLLELEITVEESEYIIDPDGGERHLHPETGLLHNETGPARIFPDGTQEWRLKGMLESINDQPSIIHSDGTREWHKADKRHRVGAPAVIRSDGTKEWYLEGLLESINDQPSVVYDDGTCEWHKAGKLHRDRGLPARIHPDGSREYYENGAWMSTEHGNDPPQRARS